jgi:hypothetical protein
MRIYIIMILKLTIYIIMSVRREIHISKQRLEENAKSNYVLQN